MFRQSQIFGLRFHFEPEPEGSDRGPWAEVFESRICNCAFATCACVARSPGQGGASCRCAAWRRSGAVSIARRKTCEAPRSGPPTWPPIIPAPPGDRAQSSQTFKLQPYLRNFHPGVKSKAARLVCKRVGNLCFQCSPARTCRCGRETSCCSCCRHRVLGFFWWGQ